MIDLKRFVTLFPLTRCEPAIQRSRQRCDPQRRSAEAAGARHADAPIGEEPAAAHTAAVGPADTCTTVVEPSEKRSGPASGENLRD